MKNYVSSAGSSFFPFHGLAIRELAPEGYPALSVAEVKVPQGATHPTARSTTSDKVYIGIEGVVTFAIDGEAIHLSPMDVLLIPASSWFAYTNDGGVEGRMLVVHTPPFDIAREELMQ